MTRRARRIVVAIAMTLIAFAAGCTPDKALDFGPVGEITTPPEDQLSRDIMRDFAGRDFNLDNNDHEAHISLTDWKPGRRIIMPYWLGVNPLYPGFLRPTVGHLYVMSQSTLVRPLGSRRIPDSRRLKTLQERHRLRSDAHALHRHRRNAPNDSPLHRHPHNHRPQRRPRHRHNHRESPSVARGVDAHAHHIRSGPIRLRQVRIGRCHSIAIAPG